MFHSHHYLKSRYRLQNYGNVLAKALREGKAYVSSCSFPALLVFVGRGRTETGLQQGNKMENYGGKSLAGDVHGG